MTTRRHHHPEFSRESLHAFDVDLDGVYELGFGTVIGAFVTR